MRIICQLSFALAWLGIVTGCASIMSGRHAEIAFDTYPENAHVVIHDHRGRQVSSFDTPGIATLKRQGRFLMPARYTATIMAPGYQTAQVPIAYTLNPWLLGNVVIGGIPGLVIDSATGAAWKPKHGELHHNLARIDAAPPSAYSQDQSSSPDRAEPAAYVADQPTGAPAELERK